MSPRLISAHSQIERMSSTRSQSPPDLQTAISSLHSCSEMAQPPPSSSQHPNKHQNSSSGGPSQSLSLYQEPDPAGPPERQARSRKERPCDSCERKQLFNHVRVWRWGRARILGNLGGTGGNGEEGVSLGGGREGRKGRSTVVELKLFTSSPSHREPSFNSSQRGRTLIIESREERVLGEGGRTKVSPGPSFELSSSLPPRPVLLSLLPSVPFLFGLCFFSACTKSSSSALGYIQAETSSGRSCLSSQSNQSIDLDPPSLLCLADFSFLYLALNRSNRQATMLSNYRRTLRRLPSHESTLHLSRAAQQEEEEGRGSSAAEAAQI